ncbi:MAG: hypothetical protein ACM3NO_00430 [Deltaproteobacteria bacterium]
MPRQIKQVLPAQCAVVKLQQDEISNHGNLADGFAGLVTVLPTSSRAP